MAIVIPLGQNKKATNAFDQLTGLVGDDLGRVNTLIADKLKIDINLVPEVAGHLVEAGGKRLRPMLTLATANMCGYEGDRHIMLAACVEFLHTATLLHDDVVDESDQRRGRPSANAIWGNSASVLVGDYLISASFQMLVKDGSLDILRVLSDAAVVIASGEVMQLEAARNMATTEDAYLDVIAAKTAALFEAACEISGVLTEQPKDEKEMLAAYGRNLGIAFQLVDDALDYRARESSLGKSLGDDFREGKITLPVVLAYRRGDEDERAFWTRTLEGGDQSDDDLSHAVELMNRHGTLDDTIDRARLYGQKAIDALALFPESAERKALEDIVEFCVARAH